MSISTEQRRLAAIMFTDMVGYTALAQRNEALALELLEEHRRILRSILPRFNGTEIKTIGDAFLVEFQSALEAAQCAVEIQRTLAKRNHDVTAERRIELKIGIHIGDVVHREGDVYGDGVNIASRIEPLAGAGGICVSMDVERQIRNALEARFEKLAPTELKNVEVPMDLFRIVLPWEREIPVVAKRSAVATASMKRSTRMLVAGAIAVILLIVGIGWWWATLPHASRAVAQSGSTAVPAKSIAVLPFENLSSDKENAYFADGIQEEILTRLSKIADLKVISRTSTQHYKSAPENLPEIARQLGVANIVEGSVQKSSDAVRVNVQLIKAANDSHLWADTYDRKLTDIFAVESEIAQRIADTLQAKLTGAEQQSITARPTQNTQAHQLYLKGRYFLNKASGDDIKKAIDYFNQAISTDDRYALAYAGLTDAYLLLPYFTAGIPQECYPKAKDAAQTALQLEDKLADAHIAFAQVLQFYDFNYAQAEVEFRRGLDLDPNNANGHWRYSWLLTDLGRSDEAFAEIKRALELDPLSLIINTDLGYFYVVAGRKDEAIAQLHRTIEMEPNFFYAHGTLGIALTLQRRFTEALNEYRKTQELSDDPYVLALLAQVYAVSGDQGQARKYLNEMQEVARRRYVQNFAFAFVYTALGEKEEALRLLEQSYRDRAGNDLATIRVDPFLAPLRGDPRFEKLADSVLGGGSASQQ